MKKYKGYLITAGIMMIIGASLWLLNAFVLKRVGEAFGANVSIDIILILAVLGTGIAFLFPNYIQKLANYKNNKHFLQIIGFALLIISVIPIISELFNLNIGYVGFGFIPVILMIISSIIVIYVGFSYDKDIKYNSENTSNSSDESDNNEDKKGN